MSKAPTKHRPKSFTAALAKLIRFLMSLALVALLGGFVLYWIAVSSAEPPTKLTRADGIVVLTGKGGGRIAAGAQLLEEGHGERLLISGVNPATDAQTMQTLLGLPLDTYNCCVDLDYKAENTFDNGKETSNWARALGYETIYLVTSSYHMPRAKVEIDSAIKGITIILTR